MKTAFVPFCLLVSLAASLAAEPLDCSEQKWDTNPIAWNVDSAAISFKSESGIAWYDSPSARRTSFSARVIPEKRTGSEWSTLGLAIGEDERNFWHLAFVVCPTSANSRVLCELSEMRDGTWISQWRDKLKLVAQRGSAKWDYRKEYILSIALDEHGVRGSVKDSGGKTVFESEFSFGDKPAVRTGRPALHATGGFHGSFRLPDAAMSGILPPRRTAETSFPPYESDSFAPDIKDTATGFFRMAEKNGKWWAIDPLGRGTVLLGIDHVSYNGHYSQRTRRALYHEWNDAHYPNHEAWVKETIARLKAWGFNLLGAGCNRTLEHRGLIHTRFLSMGDSLCRNRQDDELWICPNELRPCSAFPNVFHPLFARHCDYTARKKCAPLKNDPWLFGYFIDNELAWWGRGASMTGLFDAVMQKNDAHHAKRRLLRFVADEKTRRGFAAVPWDKVPHDVQIEIKHGFLKLAAEEYFSVTSAAIRRHDPNHLVLGARFAGLDGAATSVWEIAGKYCDIVTFNCYPWADIDRNVMMYHSGRNAERVADAFAERYAIVKRPMLVTEWSFPALDSGLPCTHGAGQRFRTQTERTAATELFAKTMLSLPFLIGYDYFMWVDEPAAGISDNFPEDSNYGLVNEQGKPYPEITSMFARLQNNIGKWRAAPLPAERPAPSASGISAADLRARNYAASAKTVFTPSGPSSGSLSNSAGLSLKYGTPEQKKGIAVSLNGRSIGDYCGMLRLSAPDGGNLWLNASHIVSAEWKDSSLYVVFECRTPAHRFTLTHRITPSPDKPRFLAELTEVRNLGENPMDVKSFFFRAYASYAAETKKENLKWVPNLWKARRADSWIAADGRRFGLMSDAPSADICRFYYNPSHGTQHPDAICNPDEKISIAPGAFYRPEEGSVWYEAVCGLDGTDGWKRITAP